MGGMIPEEDSSVMALKEASDYVEISEDILEGK